MTHPYIEKLAIKSPDWHDRRRKFIGGSDANIIMGGNPDKIYRLWQEKRGEIKPEDLSDKLPVLMGTLTEELNLAWFEDKTGMAVTRKGEHVKVGFMSCTLDGYVEAENAVVEAKHIGGFVPWEDTVKGYYPQLQHTMHVTGAKHAYLSAFVGSATWRNEKVELDPFYIEQLIDAETKFWACVNSGIPPVEITQVEVVTGAATRIVDMSTSNAWVSAAADYVKNEAASKTFEKAKGELKSLVGNDVKKAYGGGLTITRDAKGALRFKLGE